MTPDATEILEMSSLFSVRFPWPMSAILPGMLWIGRETTIDAGSIPTQTVVERDGAVSSSMPMMMIMTTTWEEQHRVVDNSCQMVDGLVTELGEIGSGM